MLPLISSSYPRCPENDSPLLTEAQSDWDAVLLAARRGDLQPLGKFLQEAAPSLEKVAARCVPDHFRHELLDSDLLQEAMLRTLQHIAAFPGQSQQDLLSYLRVTVRHTARDAVRGLSAKKRGSGRTVPLDAGGRPVEVADRRQTNPARGLEQREQKDHLYKLLWLLPVDDQFLVMWWLDGCPLVELAAKWDMSVNALRKHLDCITDFLHQRAQ